MGNAVLNFNMAGAGQPWSELFLLVLDKNEQIIHDLNLLRYMPLTWPLGHIGTAVSKPEEDKDIPKPSATPYLTLVMPFILFLLFGEKICTILFLKTIVSSSIEKKKS